MLFWALVTKGYWEKEDETKKNFIYDSDTQQYLLKTGDLGFMDDDGEIFITGRIKDNKISMGIALRHFDIACNKFGLEVDYSKIDVKKRMAKEYYITATLK